jgi:exosome complex component CSL4
MSKAKNIKGKVFPGEPLAVIEEYSEGEGSYRDDGNVRSAELGAPKINTEKRVVEVKKVTKALNLPLEGTEVIAEAGSITRRDARVDIFLVASKRVEPTYTGVIHANDVSREYNRNLEQALRSGDIIKAVVVNTKNTLIQLSMQPPEYGVVYAYCGRCGTILENRGGRLTCPSCQRVERRQTARSYGREELN